MPSRNAASNVVAPSRMESLAMSFLSAFAGGGGAAERVVVHHRDHGVRRVIVLFVEKLKKIIRDKGEFLWTLFGFKEGSCEQAAIVKNF